MKFLTHQKFIISCLPTEEEPDKDVTPLQFFTHFQFLNQDSAEEAFKLAVSSLCESESQSITTDQKTYLVLSFEGNDYADLDTAPLAKYWATMKDTQ